jgi:hypothetical protein
VRLPPPFFPLAEDLSMTTATLIVSDSTKTKSGRRIPKVGDTDVKFGRFPAVILGVDNPSDPDSDLAVAYVDEGHRRIREGVEHRLAPDGWIFEGEAEAARVRTPLEAWAEAKAAGERVPEAGLIVTFGWNRSKGGYDIVPVRARITNVFSLTEVALDVLRVQMPDDPEAPEIVSLRIPRARALSAASEHDEKTGYSGLWDYREEQRLVPFGPHKACEIFPPHRCQACGAGSQKLYAVPLPPDNGGDREIRVCIERCLPRVRDILLTPPSSALVPVTA